MQAVEKTKNINSLSLVIALLSLVGGGFFEYSSALCSVVLGVLLIVKIARQGNVKININISSIGVFALVFFYGICAFWAVDSGMAIIGFIKFLPLILFSLILMQGGGVKLSFLPYFAAGITAVSAVLAQIPQLEAQFLVAGRLSGLFQYPNTFALFLLVAELILINNFKNKWFNYITLALLIFGIFYSGSRTGFILAAVFNIMTIKSLKNRILKWSILGGIILLIFGVAIYGVATNGFSTFARFLTISFTESTFLGRILYFKDALPLIANHPLGLGYMGYYYLQPTIQTGVYNVMYIHNDFLQLLLDIGWLPTVLFTAALLKSLCSKRLPRVNKWIIAAIALHSCFDFNLQFISVWLILLSVMDWDGGKEFVVTKGKAAVCVFSALSALISLYFGIAMLFTAVGKYSAANKMLPFYTYNQMCELSITEDAACAENIADSILSRNEYAVLAYNIKALCAYGEGDFGQVIKYKNFIFDLAPLKYEEYSEYCGMLINGINLYQQIGDQNSIITCEKELLYTRDLLKENAKKVSRLGSMIDDKFKSELPQEYESYIEAIE